MTEVESSITSPWSSITSQWSSITSQWSVREWDKYQSRACRNVVLRLTFLTPSTLSSLASWISISLCSSSEISAYICKRVESSQLHSAGQLYSSSNEFLQHIDVPPSALASLISCSRFFLAKASAAIDSLRDCFFNLGIARRRGMIFRALLPDWMVRSGVLKRCCQQIKACHSTE